MYLNNGSFKFEVDPHQFNLRLHYFSQFQRKGRKKNQKLADLWLVGKMVNRIGIYGSKVAEGLSAFQRRSCLGCNNSSMLKFKWLFNSLAPGGFENIFQNVFFKLISWIDTLSNSCETVLRRMPQNPSDDKSTLVQVMAWCRQATSHYLSQCCPRSLSPYGVTRPQWVNLTMNGHSL